MLAIGCVSFLAPVSDRRFRRKCYPYRMQELKINFVLPEMLSPKDASSVPTLFTQYEKNKKKLLLYYRLA
jgi:hypothetical protein